MQTLFIKAQDFMSSLGGYYGIFWIVIFCIQLWSEPKYFLHNLKVFNNSKWFQKVKLYFHHYATETTFFLAK